ncbi:hypothetical protein C6P40_002498 [Pichia californica]|uniref:Uncharacterized protein n=1 Tax=Pichia californica TaxID=460514 RepID=A0A9P6WJR5_9ASCO|nr:hypothetical protein C6P42_002474 [[Candida] californica]KAG0687328.1 hypothetical protein C6P40_002498 [[Candida] californica]
MTSKVKWEDTSLPAGNPLIVPAHIIKENVPLVFSSGIVGVDKNGEYPLELEIQIINAFENLKVVLEAAGCESLNNVIRVFLMVKDSSYVPTVNTIFKRYFTGKPSRTCVVVGFPCEKILVEVECIAALHPKKPSSKL